MRMKMVMMLAAVVLMFAARTSAHHAFAAEFDANKPIKLRGTVVKMEWINPHTWIHLDVKTPKGTVERWMIEGGPPNALYRRGVTKDSLPNGVEILVEGFRAKDGSLKGNGRDLTFADGRRLFVGSSGTGAPRDRSTDKDGGSNGARLIPIPDPILLRQINPASSTTSVCLSATAA